MDNGANINHLLDNGLSALMICMIRYYTSDKFLPNTALKHQDLVTNLAHFFKRFVFFLELTCFLINLTAIDEKNQREIHGCTGR